MQSQLTQLYEALLTAVLLPLGLLVSLLFVRLLAAFWSTMTRNRALPIVVHPLNFEHNMRELVPRQRDELLALPSLLRDFIAVDSELRPKLAPGPVAPMIPPLTAAAPRESGPTSWTNRILELVYPQTRAAYNLVLVPEVPQSGLAIGAQLVVSPKNRLIAARSFRATEMDELVLQVGSFCIETVLEQPAVLRPTPRWEHYRYGAYEFFRRAYREQRTAKDGDSAASYEAAHRAYTAAGRLAPGNVRIALHHGGLHENRREFKEAALTYNVASCLWQQNVDLSFRLAAATVNYIITAEPALDPDVAIGLVGEANRFLSVARRNLRALSIFRRAAVHTINFRRRDYGERRYWISWLRADSYRAPLKLLRRSKGHEYKCALDVSVAGNYVLLHTIGGVTSEKIGPDNGVENLRVRVLGVVDKKRSGWLAHWSAVCFFSRAMEVPVDRIPDRKLWQGDFEEVKSRSISHFGEAFERVGKSAASAEARTKGPAAAPGDLREQWQDYCSQRAIRELGRVVRNPCSQLDPELLVSDPDIARLRQAGRGWVVDVLAGLGGTAPRTSGDQQAPISTQPPLPPPLSGLR